jgi:hypothetical protein
MGPQEDVYKCMERQIYTSLGSKHGMQTLWNMQGSEGFPKIWQNIELNDNLD